MPSVMLQASVEMQDQGPLIVLAGEADVTCEARLSELLAGQLTDGTRHLTVDLSGLRFADVAAIRTLVLAARMLTERNGRMVLLHPQRAVASVLALLELEQVLTIVTGAEAAPKAGI